MAKVARGVELEREISSVAGSELGVRIVTQVCVALHTGIAQTAVDGITEGLLFDK
jgi:hypothetical protein